MLEEIWMSPLFWGAVLALIGVLAGIIATLRRDSAAIAIQYAQEARSDVQQMRQQILDLSNQVKKLSRQTRLLEEKYSVALTDAATVRIAVATVKQRLAGDGVFTADLPPVPCLIAADMRHDWPEVFEGVEE